MSTYHPIEHAPSYAAIFAVQRRALNPALWVSEERWHRYSDGARKAFALYLLGMGGEFARVRFGLPRKTTEEQ